MLCLYYFNALMLKLAHVQFIVFYFISVQLYEISWCRCISNYLWCMKFQLLWTTEQHGPYISCFAGFPISEYIYCVGVPGLYNNYLVPVSECCLAVFSFCLGFFAPCMGHFFLCICVVYKRGVAGIWGEGGVGAGVQLAQKLLRLTHCQRNS